MMTRVSRNAARLAADRLGPVSGPEAEALRGLLSTGLLRDGEADLAFHLSERESDLLLAVIPPDVRRAETSREAG
jgi:hypothetical protein